MKKYFFPLLLLLLLGACNSKNRNEQNNVLTVTIEPQRYFLEQIVGDKFVVNTLVPPGVSPETFDPSPSVMINLGRSRAYFKVGFLGYENAWSGSLAENNAQVQIVDCSEGIEPVFEGHGACCSHTHEGDEHHNHSHGHGHSHISAGDPHIWSSAKNALKISENMLRAIIDIDAENADYYRENFEKLQAKIIQTDSIISNLTRELPARSFIIYHPALGYFARDNGLTQHSIEFEGKKPSTAQIKKLVDLARYENIKVIFVQKEFDEKSAEVIANEIGAKLYVINPLSYEWDKELIRIAKILAYQ